MILSNAEMDSVPPAVDRVVRMSYNECLSSDAFFGLCVGVGEGEVGPIIDDDDTNGICPISCQTMSTSWE